jgi:glycosyltransferase involved in cell wall biosynthesis
MVKPTTANGSAPTHFGTAAAAPVLSSIVLNWNRADLLKRTLESIAATITVPHEIFVIDNGSTDESHDIIAAFRRQHPSVEAILLDENRGGEAINLALERATGKYIHITENDIEYLPGWCETAIGLFECFPELGQLSPFGPMPEDDEVWVEKPCVLRHSQGNILYESFVNLGTTCILRRKLVEQGLRVHNLATSGKYLFPDDIRLSNEIKSAGYFIAFASHYLVHNLGHRASEFAARPEYYQENYRSKPVGEAGWRSRIEQWQTRPRPKRKSFLFPNDPTCTEKSAANAECAEPWLWSMFDGWTAELETIEFLYTLIRLTKPKFVLETGTWHGTAALAMGAALRDNARGSLVSIELDTESHEVAKYRIEEARLQDRVTLIHGSSLEFTPDRPIDFALFDSELSLRGQEFERFRQHLAAGAIVLFHDTNSAHRVVGESVNKLLSDGVLEGFFLSTPRGLALCRYRG